MQEIVGAIGPLGAILGLGRLGVFWCGIQGLTLATFERPNLSTKYESVSTPKHSNGVSENV